jgi:hypothetical protein
MAAKQGVDRRAFVALAMAFSAIGLPATGIANHLHQFEGLTRARHAWMSAHNSLAFLFVVFAAWHVALNWRPLTRHARGLAARFPSVSREAALAAALVGGLLLLAVGHAPHLG